LSLDTSDNGNNDTDDDDVGVSGHRWEELGTKLQRDKHHENVCAELSGNGKKAASKSPAVLRQRITITDERKAENLRRAAVASLVARPLYSRPSANREPEHARASVDTRNDVETTKR